MSDTLSSHHPLGFADVVAATPDRTALIEPDGHALSYGELDARVNQLAHALAALGLQTGDGVAAILPNSRHYFELRLATGRTGQYFTPISHHLTAAEIAYIVEDCEARVVVVDESLLGAAEQALDEAGFPADRRIVAGAAEGWTGYEEVLREQPTTPPDHPRAGSIMMYTSGTTGRPKGVRRQLPEGPPQVTETELNLMPRLDIFPGHEVQLAAAPLYHAAPGVFAHSGLNFGHTVVIAERPTPEEWLRLIDRHQVSITFAVPTVLHRLLRLPEEVRGRYDTSSLRSVVHGAAPCPAEVKRAAIDWLGPVVHEFYAATEGPATAATAREWLTRPGTVGRPLPGIEIRVVDPAGKPLPTGETGSVYYSPSYPFEYFKDPEKTAASMHDGLLTAGDIGYLDEDGWLFLCDRRTDLIISGGVNVYPAEVEAVLLAHPDVADAAVVGVPDAEWGRRVIAVVQPEAGVAAGDELAARLTAHCRTLLAGFKIPRIISFTDRLPRTPTGKVRRRELRTADAPP
ncbi:AMP-binding protein [Streptomyces sp. GESEQ-35]|uniref:AMP-binding protein n=1 Tax=Streptomyces sp. GESEQ-35 TaxID=2812657 RepID=UPI0027E24FE4|nr:AMP-binding protein [Streptomyces sp. GESEQ-35]